MDSLPRLFPLVPNFVKSQLSGVSDISDFRWISYESLLPTVRKVLHGSTANDLFIHALCALHRYPNILAIGGYIFIKPLTARFSARVTGESDLLKQLVEQKRIQRSGKIYTVPSVQYPYLVIDIRSQQIYIPRKDELYEFFKRVYNVMIAASTHDIKFEFHFKVPLVVPNFKSIGTYCLGKASNLVDRDKANIVAILLLILNSVGNSDYSLPLVDWTVSGSIKNPQKLLSTYTTASNTPLKIDEWIALMALTGKYIKPQYKLESLTTFIYDDAEVPKVLREYHKKED